MMTADVTKQPRSHWVACTLIVLTWEVSLPAANFTTGGHRAVKFGVHEITLSGPTGVAAPFDVRVTVTFRPPSGPAQSKTVQAFHDGDALWRARVYPTEAGAWTWGSRCESVPELNGQSGRFDVDESRLRGRLLPSPRNPRHWITENGQWFLNLNDTAYRWLSEYDGRGEAISDDVAQRYIRDLDAHGITSIRSFLFSFTPASRSANAELQEVWRDAFFTDPEQTQLHLGHLRVADRRLRWLLDEYPDIQVQLIMFPMGCRYANDQVVWQSYSTEQRERLLRNLVARFAAYPQVFWLSVNDVHFGEKYPLNNAFAKEVGEYLQQHDPWQHPFSAGHARRVPFALAEEPWIDYLHIEDEHELAAERAASYDTAGKPVFLGEDRYEQDHGSQRDPSHMSYWQRRLFWAWLLSGGSANYGGRFWVLQPYSQEAQQPTTRLHQGRTEIRFDTGLTGLDSVKPIRDYFVSRRIDLSEFAPEDALVRDLGGGEGVRRPKLMHRGRQEYLIYHPHAAEDGRNARLREDSTAAIQVDLREAVGPFSLEWYRAEDGLLLADQPVQGGQWLKLTAPWAGCDVVVRLQAHSP